MKRSGCAISGRLIRLGMTLALIGILLTAAEAFAGEPGDGRPGTTGSVWVKKLVDRAVIRLGDTSNDMLPFLIMAGLLAVAAFLMWRFPGNQTARRVVQTVSAAAFIVGIHPCGCMTRDLVLGIGWLSASDLTAFKYMIVFVTAGAFTAVVGRSFCGWLCPVGYAQELISLASRRLYRAIDGGRIARVVLHVSIFFGAGLVIYCAIFISLKLPQAARNGDLSLLVPQFTSEALLPYGAAYLAAAVIGAFGALLRSVLLTKYLFDVEILVANMYAFYRTKPGTYSVIGNAMAFFVMGLALIVLIILGEFHRLIQTIADGEDSCGGRVGGHSEGLHGRAPCRGRFEDRFLDVRTITDIEPLSTLFPDNSEDFSRFLQIPLCRGRRPRIDPTGSGDSGDGSGDQEDGTP